MFFASSRLKGHWQISKSMCFEKYYFCDKQGRRKLFYGRGLSKNVGHHGFAQKTTLILRISTLLKLTIKCSQNTAKNLSQFTNFSANMFLFGVTKNICTVPSPDA